MLIGWLFGGNLLLSDCASEARQRAPSESDHSLKIAHYFRSMHDDMRRVESTGPSLMHDCRSRSSLAPMETISNKDVISTASRQSLGVVHSNRRVMRIWRCLSTGWWHSSVTRMMLAACVGQRYV